MPETGFVTNPEYQKHIRGEWRTIHNLWPHIRKYVPGYGYSRADIDAMFEGYSGTGKALIDASNVGGLTAGSIPFAGATGFLTQDNANLFWDETNAFLGIHETTPTALVHINSVGGAIPALNLESGAEGELVTPDGQQLRFGHWNGVDTFTERMKIDAAGLVHVSYLDAGRVVFAGAGGEIKQNVNLFWDDGNARLGVGTAPLNVLDVDGAGTVTGGTSYGGVVARFSTTDDKHVSVAIDANTGKDPVLSFAENGSCIWDIRNDASAPDEFQVRYQVGEVNLTYLAITAAGDIRIPLGYLALMNGEELRFWDVGSSHYVGFEAPALTGNQIWVLPDADGGAGEALVTDGGGNLSFAAVSDEKVKVDVGAVAGYLGAAFNDGVLRTGTSMTYVDGGNFVTLNTIQDIQTSASPTFAGLTLTDIFSEDHGGDHNLFLGYLAGTGIQAGGQHNLFLGEEAGKAITTGDDNVIVGYQAALHNVTGLKNVVIGYQAGLGVAANSYNQNILIGYQAGLGMTTGYNNVLIGHQAGAAHTNLANTVAIGYQALEKCTVGGNVAIGKSAAELCTSASGIVAIGQQALDALTTGDNHVAIGTNALGAMQTANECIAIGIYALALATASYNIGIGAYAGAAITGGYRNIAIGGYALNKADTQIGNVAIGDNACMYVKGYYNIGIGAYAGQSDIAQTAVQHNVCIGYEAGKDIKNTAGIEGHYNLFVGTQAGRYSSLGISNTAIGYRALYYNLNGDYNVSIGYESGGFLKGSTNDINNMICIGYRAGSSLETNVAASNILIGSNAGRLITTGGSNIAIGDASLDALTTGYQNCCIGLWTGTSLTANYNVHIGNKAGTFTVAGNSNVYVGVQAAYFNVHGANNTAIGHDAMKGTTGMTVSGTVAIGLQSLYRINSGATDNTAVGYFTLNDLTIGDYNTAIGAWAGYEMYTTSSRNTLIGRHAGYGVPTNIYNDNTFIGYNCGRAITTGSTNTIIGSQAGLLLTSGSGNVFLGYLAGSQETIDSNKLFIANTNTTTPLIYGEFPNALLKIQVTNFNVIGTCNLGDGGVTNYASIATDGTITLVGTARVTKRIFLNNAAFTKGGTAPTQVILGNLNGWEFDIGDDAVMTSMIPDDWDGTTALTIKICWYIDEAYAADKEIQWRVDWSALPHDFSEAVDAPTHSGQIDSGDIDIPAVAKRMGLSTIGTIAAAALSAGDMLGFTLSRIAVTHDNPTAKPTAHHLMIEYTSNKIGT